jgi:hypothetical protein
MFIYNMGTGIAINLGAGWSGVRIPVGARNYSLFNKTFRPALGLSKPPIQWVPAFFPWGKAAGV